MGILLQPFSCPYRLATIWQLLMTVRLSLYSLGTDCIENTASSGPLRSDGRLLIEPLPRNGEGRAIAEAVSRWLPTAAARVQSRVWSSGIFWWTKWRRGRYNRPVSGRRAEWTQFELYHTTDSV
jgi:hypothetical protein